MPKISQLKVQDIKPACLFMDDELQVATIPPCDAATDISRLEDEDVWLVLEGSFEVQYLTSCEDGGYA